MKAFKEITQSLLECNPLIIYNYNKLKLVLTEVKTMTVEEIPREVAIKLCNEIQAENKRKRFSKERLQCWGCCKYAKGDIEKMCISGKGGCNLVNKRYGLQRGADNER